MFVFLDLTIFLPKKCTFGAIHKVENNFIDFFEVENWGLQLGRSAYFVSFTR